MSRHDLDHQTNGFPPPSSSNPKYMAPDMQPPNKNIPLPAKNSHVFSPPQHQFLPSSLRPINQFNTNTSSSHEFVGQGANPLTSSDLYDTATSRFRPSANASTQQHPTLTSHRASIPTSIRSIKPIPNRNAISTNGSINNPDNNNNPKHDFPISSYLNDDDFLPTAGNDIVPASGDSPTHHRHYNEHHHHHQDDDGDNRTTAGTEMRFFLNTGENDEDFDGDGRNYNQLSPRANNNGPQHPSSVGVPGAFLADGPSDGDEKQSTTISWATSSWAQRRRYLSYYLPISTWLPQYSWSTQLIPDLSAGLSVGAMLVPQCMAYASIVHLPPLYGLVTAFFSGVTYFILGHSPILTVGPGAATSILLSDAIDELPAVLAAKAAGQDPTLALQQGASAISFITGLITLTFGILRLGFVDSVFSRPVLEGFVLAVGLQLTLDQTPKVFGVAPCATCTSAVSKLHYVWDTILVQWDVNYCSIILGLGSVAYLGYYASLRRKYPESAFLARFPHIFALVFLATFASYIGNLSERFGISVIGNKNNTMPPFAMPSIFQNSRDYFSAALAISILGFIETQLVNKTTNLPQSTVSPNRELIALGVGHMTSSLFGGYVAYGSITRTRVGLAAGATSQIANAIALLMCLTSILFLMPFFAYLPTPTTSGIIFFVATNLVDFHQTAFAFHTRQWIDLSLNIAMMFVTFFFGVDIGIFFGFICCLLFVIKQQNKPSVRLLGRLRPQHAGLPAGSLVSATRTEGTEADDDTPSLQRSESVLSNASTSSVAQHARVLHAHEEENAPTDATSPATAAAGGMGEADDDYFEFDDNAQLHSCELEGVLIYQIDGPLFFCNAENLKERMRRVEKYGCVMSHPSEPPHPLNLRAIIFDLQSVTTMDSTAAQVFVELVTDYHKRNIRVVFVKLRKTLLPLLVDAGVTKIVGMYSFKRNIDAAIDYVERLERL